MTPDETKKFPAWFAFVLVGATLTLTLGGTWFYLSQRQMVLHTTTDQLTSIGQLKADQIAAWRAERLADAAVLTKGRLLGDGVARFQADPSNENAQPLLSQLRSLMTYTAYSKVMLLDPKGYMLLGPTKELAFGGEYVEILADSLRERKPLLSEIHSDVHIQTPHITLVAPIFDGDGPAAPALGAVVLVSAASRFLYPLIESWPTSTTTSETLLVRRDGDNALFLNNLRFQPDAALKLRIPLSRTNVPAVMAILGQQGLVQGKDYRGVNVLADICPIPNSNWFIVVKQDETEVFADWHFRALLIIALLLSIEGGLLGIGLLAWQRRQKSHFQAMYAAEASMRIDMERHSVALKSIADAVIATDAQGRVELLNPVAEVLTGWEDAAARGRPLADVFHLIDEKTQEKVENPIASTLLDGTFVAPAPPTLLISKVGRQLPIASSAAPIRSARGEIIGAVLVFRDQTAERAAQSALANKAAMLAKTEGISHVGSWRLDLETGKVTWSDETYNIFGLDQTLSPHEVNEAFAVAVHPEDRTQIDAMNSATRQDGIPRPLDYRIVRPDGSVRWVHAQREQELDAAGQVVALAGFVQDITERKQAEESLKKAHDELERRVLERTADLVAAIESLNREFIDRKRRGEVFRVGLLVSELASSHSLDALLQASLDEIERLTGSRIGFFHFLEEDQQTLLLQTWSTSTLTSFCSAEGKNRHYNVDEAGVWVECVHQRRPVIHNDYASLPHRKGLPPGHAAVVRQLVVPIIRGDKIVAILGVGNKPRNYDEQDIETVSDLANMTYDAMLRQQAEEQVFNIISTLTMVIDGISDPLIVLDAELRVKRLNKSARDYYRLTSDQEALGKPCYEAFRQRSSPCEGCKQPFSTMGGYSGSYERPGMFDSKKTEQVFVDLVADGSGKPLATILRIHDITQTKFIDRQLLQSEKLSALGLLIAGIAHEINNPNNFIFFNTPILRSYLQFLLPFADEYVSSHPETLAFGRPYPAFREDCFKLLDNIEHGSTRINQIVGNLREFVSERGKGAKRWIDLKQIVEKGISICLGRIRKAVKTFDTSIPEGLPPIFTDPLAVEQVMVNLLINAMQAADKDDSWVRLQIRSPQEAGGEVVLEVSDNGCGMDAATQRKIFDPFFTTKEVGVGTGLGLSISHRLVEELGGRIEVESEAGVGTTFRVFLQSAPAKVPKNEDELTC